MIVNITAKKQEPPKKVALAYQQLKSAQSVLRKSCEVFAPEAPVKKGDKLWFSLAGRDVESEIQFMRGVVISVKYEPYGVNNFGGWTIGIRPVTETWEAHTTTRYAKYLNVYSVIRFKEEEEKQTG